MSTNAWKTASAPRSSVAKSGVARFHAARCRKEWKKTSIEIRKLARLVRDRASLRREKPATCVSFRRQLQSHLSGLATTSHPAACHRQPFRERGPRGTGGATGASLIVRPSPRLLEAPRTAQLRLSKAEADATCEHQRNRAGEAILVPRMNLRAASVCFEIQFRIQWTGSKRWRKGE